MPHWDSGEVDENETLHGALSICGIIGGPCAVADIGVYLRQGDGVGAAVATLGVFPFERLLRHVPAWALKLLGKADRFSPGGIARHLLESRTSWVSRGEITAFSPDRGTAIGKPHNLVWKGKLDLGPTLRAIAKGDAPSKVFYNRIVGNTGRRALPLATSGYYREFVVALPGLNYRESTARIIIGAGGEAYFNPWHYMPGQWYRL